MPYLVLESATVIRVGASGVPYAVAVVRGPNGLVAGRLDVDVDALPELGSQVAETGTVSTANTASAPVFSVIDTPAKLRGQ